MATRHGGVYDATCRSCVNPLTGTPSTVAQLASSLSAESEARSAQRYSLPFFVPKQPGQAAYQPPIKPLRVSYEDSLAKPVSTPSPRSHILRPLSARDDKLAASPISHDRVSLRALKQAQTQREGASAGGASGGRGSASARPTTSVVLMHSPPPFGTTELVLRVASTAAAEAAASSQRAGPGATASSVKHAGTLDAQAAAVRAALAGPAQVTIAPGANMRALQTRLLELTGQAPPGMSSSRSSHAAGLRSGTSSGANSGFNTPRDSRSRSHSQANSRSASRSVSQSSSRVHSRRNSLVLTTPPASGAGRSGSLRYAMMTSPESLPAAGQARSSSAHPPGTAPANDRYSRHGMASSVDLSHPDDFVAADVGRSRNFQAHVRAQVTAKLNDGYDASAPPSAAGSKAASRRGSGAASAFASPRGASVPRTPRGAYGYAASGTNSRSRSGTATPTRRPATAAPAASSSSSSSAAPAASSSSEGYVHVEALDSNGSAAELVPESLMARPGAWEPRTEALAHADAERDADAEPGAATPVQPPPQWVSPASARAATAASSKPSTGASARRAGTGAVSGTQTSRTAASSSSAAAARGSSRSVSGSVTPASRSRSSSVSGPSARPALPSRTPSQAQSSSTKKTKVHVSEDMPAAGKPSNVLFQATNKKHLEADGSPTHGRRGSTSGTSTPRTHRPSPSPSSARGVGASNSSGSVTPRTTLSRSHSRAGSGTTTPVRRGSISSSASAPSSAARTAQVSALQSQLAKLQMELKNIHNEAAGGTSSGGANASVSSARKARPVSSSGAGSSPPASARAASSSSSSSSSATPYMQLGSLMAGEALGNTATGFKPSGGSSSTRAASLKKKQNDPATSPAATSTRAQLDPSRSVSNAPPAGQSRRSVRGVGSALPTEEYSIAHPPPPPSRFHSALAVDAVSNFDGPSVASVGAGPAQREQRHRVQKVPFVHPDDEAKVFAAGPSDAPFLSTNTESGSVPMGGPLLHDPRAARPVKKTRTLGPGPLANQRHAYHQSSDMAAPVQIPVKNPATPKLWKV